MMKEGNIWLITVAGRFFGKAEGINIPEFTHLLRVLGSDNGIINKLCDNKLYDNKGERKAANSLCVYE